MKEIKDLFLIKKNDIILCHGVFDLFHIGHLNYLKKAKQLGGKLMVSITGDNFVRKGPNRPVFNESQRLEILKSLDCVDYVYVNHDYDAVSLIKKLKPKYYCKGKDYSNSKNDLTGKIKVETREVLKNGGKLIIINEELYSSSNLINLYLSNLNNDQKNKVKSIKKKTNIYKIIKILNSLSNLNLSMIGESIIDKYTFCIPENLSTKSPTVSSKFVSSEEYLGGILAIARNANELGTSIQLITNISKKNEILFRSKLNNKKIKINNLKISTSDIIKERFISVEKNQRLFEIFNSNTLKLNEESWKKIKKIQTKNNNIIVADYGHGLISEKFYNFFKKRLFVNVQTNSENYGFNRINKVKSCKYFSIDEREARLGIEDRFSDIEVLTNKIKSKYNKNSFSITLGSKGSIIYSKTKNDFFSCPAFFDKGLDATGAGDLYFLMSSLLEMLNIDPEINIFISNIYAGLKTRIQGNSQVVKKTDLIKAIEHLLK